MRIGNEYVQIKKGNKNYIKQNTILDIYLQRILNSQINPSYSTRPEITNCYIKLDTPLENITPSSNLEYPNDFDIKFYKNIFEEYTFKKMSTMYKNKVDVRYKFTKDGFFQYNGNIYGSMNDFDMFDGRKITAIGFGLNNTCYAVVDVSNMNIVINQGEELSISRLDTHQSDAIVYNYDYPLHLVNYIANKDYDMNLGEQTIAQLYSVGLGNKLGLMESEHIIDFESDDVEISDTNINIIFNETISVGRYPSENLFPSEHLFPKKDNSKYILLKYRLVRVDNDDNKTYLDEYYTMSYNIDLSRYNGQQKDISFNLEIERM